MTPGTGHSLRRPEHARLDAALPAVARGGREAFANLYDLVTPPVFGLIRRMVRDPSQSEEVTQEVMLEIWRTAARYDPSQGSAIGWILTIARHRVRQVAIELRPNVLAAVGGHHRKVPEPSRSHL